MSHLKTYILVAAIGALLAGPASSADDAPKGNKGDKADRKKGPAYDGGGWDRGLVFIKEHSKELEITDEQQKKLDELKKDLGDKFAKLKDDPAMVDLYKEAHEARQSGDKDHIDEVNKKIRKALEEKGIKPEEVMGQVGKILTKQQLVKLAQLRKQNGMEENPMKKMREERAEEKKDENRERPDPNKGTPNLYDNEK